MITTFPPSNDMDELASLTPEYMRPDRTPFAVAAEGWLSHEECDAIIQWAMLQEPYEHPGCGAITREIPRPMHSSFFAVEQSVKMINNAYFKYDLDEGPAAWLQTYKAGGNYQPHVDTAPGQMRKLTAVVMLSHVDDYQGGDLEIHTLTQRWTAPKTRGTIVVFQPWHIHMVSKVNYGLRQTINMGFYGPPFK